MLYFCQLLQEVFAVMVVCKQVWWSKNPRPTQGRSHDLPPSMQTPKHWFIESPECAAELYALERWGNDAISGPINERVFVAADDGRLYVFEVDLYVEARCQVTLDLKISDGDEL